MEDIEFLKREISMWIRGILEKGWEKAARQAHLTNQSMVPIIHDRLTGLGVSEAQVLAAMRDSALPENPMNWGPEEMLRVSEAVRKYSKPMIIALNKADLADDATLKRLQESAGDLSVPTMTTPSTSRHITPASTAFKAMTSPSAKRRMR